MDTKLNSTNENHSPQDIPIQTTTLFKNQSTLFSSGVFLVLLLAAAIPRVLLARKLDMVTDEIVYIQGAKTYILLVQHLFSNLHSREWLYNYEHPPFVKLLIALSLSWNYLLGNPLNELFVSRIPSIFMGTLMILGMYYLGQGPFGRRVALLAGLCLAFSPWVAFFSSIAYLDTTMTALVTIAYLLLWPAIRRPWLYPISAMILGLAAVSKYTASLMLPGMILFTAYYFLILRRALPASERPAVPWKWWGLSILMALLAFLAFDPAIWTNPLPLLIHSFTFEWDHSIHGHLTFIAGVYAYHVPQWAILYILLNKISALITVPAALFSIVAVVKLVRFHVWKQGSVQEVVNTSFLLIWLVMGLLTYSFLNIVVGTHYHLPLAAPVAFAGVTGLAMILGFCNSFITKSLFQKEGLLKAPRFSQMQQYAVLVIFAILAVIPHLIGLTTVPEAEGYTSIFFHGENNSLQVAYQGYREGLIWLSNHHAPGKIKVGLVAISVGTLNPPNSTSWFEFNKNYTRPFHVRAEAAGQKAFPDNYLIWPMNLVQRGMKIPQPWRLHVIHTITGGNTTYCYIVAE